MLIKSTGIVITHIFQPNTNLIQEIQLDCHSTSSVKLENIQQPSDYKFLEENYMGYCTLRPTFPDIIGRNLISKNALLNNRFET